MFGVGVDVFEEGFGGGMGGFYIETPFFTHWTKDKSK
jgi:hypothetical protein